MSESKVIKQKSTDKSKVHNARKQVILCESIIRKVLAIQNCFDELKQLEDSMIIVVFIIMTRRYPK